MKSRLLQDAFAYTISNFAVAGVPFVLLPILTRALDPAAYGMVAMFSLTVAFLSVGVGLNIHGALMVRYFDKEKYDIRKYASTSIFILFISTILILTVTILNGSKLSELTSIPQSWLLIAVLVSAFQFMVLILLTLWQASKRPVQYGLLRISHALLDAASSIVFVVLLAMSWQGRLSGMVLGWACVAIVALYFLVREGWLDKSIDISYAKDALKFGVPLVPHALGGLLLGLADRFMVNNALDVSSTGIYFAATQIGLILGMLADSFNKAFAPWLMEELNGISTARKRQIVLYTYTYFLSMAFMALVGGGLAPYLLPLLVGGQYQAASSIVIYLLLGNAFVGMYYMVANYMFYSQRTGLLSALTITVGLFSTCLTWILIKNYGIEGAAVGFMLGQALLFVGAWILSNFCVPMPWFKGLAPAKN